MAVAIAALLAYGFVYLPRKNSIAITNQASLVQNLSQNLAAAKGQLVSINTHVEAQSYGSASSLADSYGKSANALKFASLRPPAKLAAMPWDSAAKAYNILIHEPGYKNMADGSMGALKNDRDYLQYQAAVWRDLAQLVEYSPAQDLADSATAAQKQSEAKDGIAAIAQKLKSLPPYADASMAEIMELVDQAANSAANDSAEEFTATISQVQTEIISNRQAFTLTIQNEVIRKLTSAQTQADIYIQHLRNL